MAILHISEVEADGLARRHLYGARIETPQAGIKNDTYGFDLVGWTVGKSGPVQSIEVSQEGISIASTPLRIERPDVESEFPGVSGARTSGFRISVGGLKLRTDFELTVHARLDDGVRVRLATIKGRRDAIRSAHEPLLNPLMINTIGRSGSTWLMWALGCHPQITSYEPFAHETRVASYWATLLQELMDPNCYLTQFDPADLAAPRWWLGDSGNHRPIVPDGALARWLGRERVPALAAMAQAQIDDFYIANADAGADVTYFVEKFSPWQMLPDLLAEIYPRAQEIILVRDFRDMFCSIRAYNAKRGQQGFGRDGVATESEYIREIVRGFGLTLLRRWRAQPERAYLLRYEDLIAEPNGTLSKLLKHLDLDAGPATVEGTLAEASRRRSGSDGHRTAPDVASSVGRWRRDLSPELLKVCEEALDPVLDEFGYERTSPHVAERA